ncbi:MAG TPA: VTT domain-containing protein [Pyrinomonadaceae bacterium]|nr:VTT domain-containing protein [Pyrinomonadaceae bacterium]
MRYLIVGIWLSVIVAGVTASFAYPQALTPQGIAGFLTRFQGQIWLVYLAISVLRGFTLLPSTPLVIAGTLLFPGQPWSVLGVSIFGILISSTMIYFFSDVLGFTAYFENRKPELIHRIKRRLEHPTGFAFVAGWAFFPLVPTDLVCYVAGVTRMNYLLFILAIFIGELILCSAYIFFGNYLINNVGPA